jgi:hypothetical protein
VQIVPFWLGWSCVLHGLSAGKGLDQGDEGGLVLEQEGVAGVGIEGEFCSGDQAGESLAVSERVESVGGAIGDECGGGDRGGLSAGSVPAHRWSTTCPWAVTGADGAAGAAG